VADEVEAGALEARTADEYEAALGGYMRACLRYGAASVEPQDRLMHRLARFALHPDGSPVRPPRMR
jgi:hypothetical protein